MLREAKVVRKFVEFMARALRSCQSRTELRKGFELRQAGHSMLAAWRQNHLIEELT